MNIKRTNKLKTNTSGFGHIEMLLLVVAVVVIGGVGFFVYQNNNKKAAPKITAHAGGWTQIDKGQYCTNSNCTTSLGFTGFACYTDAGAYGKYVKSLIVLASATPWPNGTNSTIQSLQGPTSTHNWDKFEGGNWLYGAFHTTGYYLINPSVTNLIQAYPYGPNNGGLTGYVQNMTHNWLNAPSLAGC